MEYSTQACDGCPTVSQRVALTRVDIRAPAYHLCVAPVGSGLGGSAGSRIKFLIVKSRNNYSASLFRDARYEGRHVARKPSKWKWAAAAAAAAGGIAAVATTAPWSGGSASLTADQRVTATGHSSAFGSALTNIAEAAPPARAARPVAVSAHSAPTTSAPAVAKPAVAKPAVAKPTAAKPGATIHAAQKQATTAPAATPQKSGGQASQSAQPTQSSKPAQSTQPAPSTQPAQSTQPTTFYDSVEPGAIPAGAQVATYADGPYAQSAASLAGRGKIMWIDVSGADPNADALDVEPTDATPAGAAAWVSAKLTADPSSHPIVYTFKNDWGQVIDDINALPTWMHSHVKYWIADPTGYAHILPGADATQWYWGPTYDTSSAEPGFFS
jgi:hypothetical protein